MPPESASDEAESAARWVEAVTGSTPVGHRTIEGGLTAEIRWFDFDDRPPVVVKHVMRAGADSRRLAAREADGLRAAAALSAVPTPRLLAERDGTQLMMEAMVGERVVDADGLAMRVEEMATLLASIHRQNPPSGLDDWQPWGPEPPIVPADCSPDGPWGALRDRWDSSHRPRGPIRLLHRDLQPLNLLWADERVSAVIDWANVCVGHPHADLSHLRWNVAVLAGQEVADELADRYVAVTDFGQYDRFWDLATIKGLGDFTGEGAGWRAAGRTDLRRVDVLASTERFLHEALERTR